MTPPPEDHHLIIALYSDLTIKTIAEKFDTTPRSISKILRGHRIEIGKSRHKRIVEMLRSKVGYTIDEIADEVDCSRNYVKVIKCKLGLSKKAPAPVTKESLRPVREVMSMIALGEVSIPEACAMVGISVNTYYYRRRIMLGEK